MAKHKINFYQVEKVLQGFTNDRMTAVNALRPASQRNLIGDDAPDGYFVASLNTLWLPKRKRGMQFKVIYTTIHEQII